MSTINLSQNFTNTAQTEVINGKIIEKNSPKWSWTGSFAVGGVQTTPGIARGALINTGVYITNSQVAHVCDFKFRLSTSLSLTALVPNVGILLGAIKNGKNAASAAIRTAITKLNELFRLAIDAILGSLNADVTGLISANFSFLKEKVREINEKLKIAAQVLADVAMVYYLIQEIQQITDWINSLPDRVKKILEDCVLNFKTAVASVGTQFTTSLSQTQNLLTLALVNENEAPQPTTITTYVTDPLNAKIDGLSTSIVSGIESGKAAAADYFGAKAENSDKP
jgi:hypothetical protein